MISLGEEYSYNGVEHEQMKPRHRGWCLFLHRMSVVFILSSCTKRSSVAYLVVQAFLYSQRCNLAYRFFELGGI